MVSDLRAAYTRAQSNRGAAPATDAGWSATPPTAAEPVSEQAWGRAGYADETPF
ncbi:hypothetical protein ACFSEO_09965 [Agromyces cerinus subsp. nitratus]|uniref:hypothetical protein n=1 Tax=Agromyces cerinus TaxID=33878 RepID=UPI00362E7141